MQIRAINELILRPSAVVVMRNSCCIELRKVLSFCWWGQVPKNPDPGKNKRMPLDVANTRYSLVKGERIVRSVLTTWLRALTQRFLYFIYRFWFLHVS